MEALTPDHFLLSRPSIDIPYLQDAQKYQNPYQKYRKMFRVAQAQMDYIWAILLKGISPSPYYPPEVVQGTSAIERKRPGVDYRTSGKTRFLPPWKS